MCSAVGGDLNINRFQVVTFRPQTSASFSSVSRRMDKKQKKRLDVINKKLQTLRPRLSGAKEQADDMDEIKDLEDQISKLEAEAAEIKASK